MCRANRRVGISWRSSRCKIPRLRGRPSHMSRGVRNALLAKPPLNSFAGYLCYEFKPALIQGVFVISPQTKRVVYTATKSQGFSAFVKMDVDRGLELAAEDPHEIVGYFVNHCATNFLRLERGLNLTRADMK
ncbi:hypothetical protein PoB_001103400 [Plakobranchus ocellatus]|uniref:Uncharacterized protein n=1 Tax=Plakobranchus ocellatus TaxID=259542 RepID=A0AAV3YR30_9GAST|nr:hypothetical protein PoB_001103400 [Plakobranchus ocellatus]